MTDILNIKYDPIFDNRLVKIESHMYNRQHNVRVQRDKNTHTATGSVHTTVKLSIRRGKTDEEQSGANMVLGNNCFVFIFEI